MPLFQNCNNHSAETQNKPYKIHRDFGKCKQRKAIDNPQQKFDGRATRKRRKKQKSESVLELVEMPREANGI